MYHWIKETATSQWDIALDMMDIREGFRMFDGHYCSVPFQVGPAILMPVAAMPSPAHLVAPHEAVVISLEAKTAKEVKFFDTEINGRAYLPPVIEDIKSRRPKDCGVVAIAILLGIKYPQAQVIAMHHGWSSTKGISHGFVEIAVSHRKGLVTKPVDQVVGMCVSSASDRFAKGRTYVICTKSHVMAVVDGVVFNPVGCEYDTIVSSFEVINNE